MADMLARRTIVVYYNAEHDPDCSSTGMPWRGLHYTFFQEHSLYSTRLYDLALLP